jgi:hypothetical protein
LVFDGSKQGKYILAKGTSVAILGNFCNVKYPPLFENHGVQNLVRLIYKFNLSPQIRVRI